MGTEEAVARELIGSAFYTEEANPRLVAFTRGLRPDSTLVALTNSWSFGRELLDRRGCGDLFDLVVISAEEGIRKPDPRIFQIVLERLSLRPSEVLFIDDTEENIDAAHSPGIRGVHFVTTAGAIAELQRLLRADAGPDSGHPGRATGVRPHTKHTGRASTCRR